MICLAHPDDSQILHLFVCAAEALEEPKEPVPLGESTWNALLVIGFTGAGWFDTMVASHRI